MNLDWVPVVFTKHSGNNKHMSYSKGFWGLLTGLSLILAGQSADGAETHRRILMTNQGGADRTLGICPLTQDYIGLTFNAELEGQPNALTSLLKTLTAIEPSSPKLTEREAILWQIYSQPMGSPEQQRYRQRMIENFFAVRFLLADPDTGAALMSSAPQAYQLLFQLGDPLAFVAIEKRFYLPRAYFRSEFISVASFDEFLGLLARPGVLKPFQQVAIENSHHQSVPLSSAIKDVPLHYLAENELLIRAPQAGYLVIADPLSEDSQVMVDKQPAELEFANGFQQAVWLEAGEHHVLFSRPYN